MHVDFSSKIPLKRIFMYMPTLIAKSEKNVIHSSHFFYLKCVLVLRSLDILHFES